MSLMEAARLGGVVEAVCEVADAEGMSDDLEIPIWPPCTLLAVKWPPLTVGLFRALAAAIAAEMPLGHAFMALTTDSGTWEGEPGTKADECEARVRTHGGILARCGESRDAHEGSK